jgi:hypothetical protein
MRKRQKMKATRKLRILERLMSELSEDGNPWIVAYAHRMRFNLLKRNGFIVGTIFPPMTR